MALSPHFRLGRSPIKIGAIASATLEGGTKITQIISKEFIL
ncbi:hypothetical protein [Nostoc sp. UHCC 0926]|nr:hypothetical protein [Nostoc sp. UHCC 0926]